MEGKSVGDGGGPVDGGAVGLELEGRAEGGELRVEGCGVGGKGGLEAVVGDDAAGGTELGAPDGHDLDGEGGVGDVVAGVDGIEGVEGVVEGGDGPGGVLGGHVGEAGLVLGVGVAEGLEEGGEGAADVMDEGLGGGGGAAADGHFLNARVFVVYGGELVLQGGPGGLVVGRPVAGDGAGLAAGWVGVGDGRAVEVESPGGGVEAGKDAELGLQGMGGVGGVVGGDGGEAGLDGGGVERGGAGGLELLPGDEDDGGGVDVGVGDG
jgi:hypothetical protein